MRCCIANLALFCLLQAADASLAGELSFTIDSALSHLTFSLETTGGTQITTPQTLGSDSTSLSGTMNVDVTSSKIQFLPTGNTIFALQTLPQAPLPGGATGTAPAQYGLTVSIPGTGSGVIAARNYLGDATSAPIPLVGSSFDASQLSSNLVVGNTAYNLTVLGSPVIGSIDTNFPAPNTLSGGTLTMAGGVYTLTIPMLVKGPVTISGITVDNVYSGQIVATSPVPEPGSIALAALGLIGLAAWGWRRKRSRIAALVALGVLVACAGDARAVTIAWSPVGNPGNAADTASYQGYVGGFGDVAYSYSISTYDVTNNQYAEFLNAKDPNGVNTLGLYNLQMFNDGGIGFNNAGPAGSKYSALSPATNYPVDYINWYDAIRFANWMSNGQGNGDTETGSYTLLGGTPTPSNANSIVRNLGATIVIPNNNEWYKAAYYNPATSTYYLYPTSSNTVPTAERAPGGNNSANYNEAPPQHLTDVGAYTGTTSPYGAYDMGGDVVQWTENLLNGSWRSLRGDAWAFDSQFMLAPYPIDSAVVSINFQPTGVSDTVGFRLAMVPEPSSVVLAALGLIGLAAWGWRRKRSRLAALVVLAVLVTFAGDARAVTIAWTPVGNPGNAADTTTIGGVPINLGAVGYAYQIGTYDVTNAQYAEFLNAKDPTGADPLHLYSSGMTNTAVGGISFNASSADNSHFSVIPGRGDMPLVYVNFFSTLRFANWLNNGGLPTSDTESGSYTLLHVGSPTPTQLPSNFAAITRNANATVVLPNENEWYKAAYFNPATSSYFQYPTSSNTVPTASAPTGAINSANYNNAVRNLTVVGAYTASASPYGTFDQGGDVGQWTEPKVASDGWSAHGFSYNLPAIPAGEAGRSLWLAGGVGIFDGYEDLGFRLAMVPEPSSVALAALGLIGLAAWGWRRKRSRIVALLFALLVACVTDARAVTIAWSPVGNPGNAADPATGSLHGAVGYSYNIGTYDVTNRQYAEFLNAKDPTGANSLGLFNPGMSDTHYTGIYLIAGNVSGNKYTLIPGNENHPVGAVSWYDAIRFANWLNNGQGNGDTETGAYTLLGGIPSPSNGLTITRNPGAAIFLPSENEWYKAAYYNPATSSYFQYPTSSNTVPTGGLPSGLPNHANFWPGGGGSLLPTDVGAYTGTTSPFGAYDMGGNVDQWNESLINKSYRVLRGGDWINGSLSLRASFWSEAAPGSDLPFLNDGFRVASIASVPEPSSVVLAAFGMIGLAAWSWRRKRA